MNVFEALDSDATTAAAAEFTQLIVDYLAAARTGAGPVTTSRTPSEIAAQFDEPMPLEGAPLEVVTKRLREQVIAECNRLAHPRAMGHQVAPPLPAAIWTDALIAALNQSVAVSEMSPSGTALEHRVIRWMCDLAGFPSTAGGTFTSGGTEATFAALLAARAAIFPDAWTNGIGSARPVIICGEHAHYAVARAVGELGIGTQGIVMIPSRDFRMDTDVLAAEIERLVAAGRTIMAVVATAGSTATGSFDDLERIGELCDANHLWFHVDAAHGGSALLSARHRGRLRGIAKARSIAWDPHKMMLLPLAAGIVLVREERELENAYSQRAPYLFHGREESRTLDQGTRSFQCSRRADVIKLWVALQRYGANGLGALYDGLCDVTRAFHDEVAANPSFEALHEPECNILCFRYVGDGAMNDDDLDRVNNDLRNRYNQSGAGWITSTLLAGRRVLRVTVMNPRTTIEDVCGVVSGLAATARGLSV